MNRKEFGGYAKKYGIAVLCSIPVLIALTVVLLPRLGGFWTVFVDCLLIFLAFGLTLVFSRMWQDHITKKRTEFLNKKDKERRQALLEQATSENQEETKPQKVWQKQKKNYPSNKHKK